MFTTPLWVTLTAISPQEPNSRISPKIGYAQSVAQIRANSALTNKKSKRRGGGYLPRAACFSGLFKKNGAMPGIFKVRATGWAKEHQRHKLCGREESSRPTRIFSIRGDLIFLKQRSYRAFFSSLTFFLNSPGPSPGGFFLLRKTIEKKNTTKEVDNASR